MRLPVLSVVLAFGLAGCRQESATDPAPDASVGLSGQLFTIRSDGVNLPLGGVEVAWVPASRLRDELERIRDRAPRIEALLAYESTLRDAAATLRQIRDDPRAGDPLDRFCARADGLLRRARSTFENHPDIELLLESSRFARAHELRFAGSGFERDVQSHWMLVHLFVARLAAIREVATTTDADGRFEVRLPEPAEGFLLASAQTTALGTTHHDYWILPAGKSSRDDFVLSPRSRLGPQRFRALREVQSGDPEPPRLAERYGLPDLAPLVAALARYDEVARNLDQREHLEHRIEVLRRELREAVPPEAN